MAISNAHIKNPRKGFLWSIRFINHPINAFLFQSVTLPERGIEEVAHGDINRDVKTGGRATIGDLVARKLETTSGSDTWLWDWMSSVQDTMLQGGLTPSMYWEDVIVDELAEDGKSVINSWVIQEVWPKTLNGQALDRMTSENTIEEITFSVGNMEKL